MQFGDAVMVLGEVRKPYALAPFDSSLIGRMGIVAQDPPFGGYVYVRLDGDNVGDLTLFDERELAEVS